ncbi:MAG: hypothetical protein MUP81_03660 [Dehalococcoidia bacterium]|nr:hypothetical protein [Dehalococcoidia bacterium]
MEIERIDLYDFKVVLGEIEFAHVVRLSEKMGISFELALAEIWGMGLTDSNDIIKRKE